MNHPHDGKFYLKYDGESVDEALDAHSDGYDTIAKAIEEGNLSPEETYVVLDDNLKIVARGGKYA